MNVLVFSVPMPPNVTNRASGKSHWRVIHREKKSFLAQLDELQAAGVLPPPPILPLKRALLSSRMFLGNAMDDDNALARHKPLLDWLKTRGYVVDDRKKHLAWHALPEQVVQRKDKRYRIELTVRELLP